MKTLFRILGTAAAVAVTGAAIVVLDKILNQKDPLHVESVEFPEDAELDAKEAAKAAEAYAEGESKAEAAAPAEEAAPEAPAQPPEPDPDAGKHAFEVFLDCIAMDDGLVQYLIDVLKRMDRAEFFKLSQITTKLDLDPEEFLYWLAHRQDYAGEDERACAAVMDAVLLRLAEEGRLDAWAALLSGDRKTFEALRCEAPELVHAPVATYDWYAQHYLDRDYPIRLIMRLNGVKFPD